MLGIGRESVRGTAVTPAIWVPGREGANVAIKVDKADIRETRGTKVASQGSEIVQKYAGGDLPFNVRHKSIGYILLSLLGSVTTTTVETGVYKHTFSILPNDPAHPSLTLGLSMPGIQDYVYALALASALELTIAPDDLVNAVASFVAKSEAEKSPAYTPSFGTDDIHFRHQDVSLKFASNLAGLGAASPTLAKEIGLTIDNKARTNQRISEINPGDVIAAGGFEIGGTLRLDLTAKTLHDIFAAGTYQAMQVAMVRSDVLIGASSNPSITVKLPKVSFTSYETDRPLDDIVGESIGYNAHFSDTDGSAITVEVVNTKANYTS